MNEGVISFLVIPFADIVLCINLGSIAIIILCISYYWFSYGMCTCIHCCHTAPIKCSGTNLLGTEERSHAMNLVT